MITVWIASDIAEALLIEARKAAWPPDFHA